MDIQAEKLALFEWLNSISEQSIIERLKLFRENFALGSDWLEPISDVMCNLVLRSNIISNSKYTCYE